MKKKRTRGRPKGSINKQGKDYVCTYLTDIVLKCKVCKRVFIITTQKKNIDEIYTSKVKENWKCLICNEKEKIK